MSLVVIAHDIRSTHNVGSLLRTAEGLGVDCIYFTGITPYPTNSGQHDGRLPHLSLKLSKQIHKTALGAEITQKWEYHENIQELFMKLKAGGYSIVGLEQDPSSTMLSKFNPPQKTAILLGREVEGIERELLSQCDHIIEIPMRGQKESFNVVQAAAIVMYTLLCERD